MPARKLLLCLGALTLVLLVQNSTDARQGKGKKGGSKSKESASKNQVDVAPVFWEVKAYQELNSLELSPDQLRALADVAKQTAGAQKPIQGSEALQKTLADLKAALVKNDEDAISDLEAKLDDLQDSEDADLDQEPELTDAAKAAAPKVLLSLTVEQIKALLNDHDEEVADPLEVMREAIDDGQGMKNAEWQELRNETAATVGQLVSGFSHEKVETQVAAFLDKAHRLSESERKAQQKELDQEAKQIVAVATPLEILQHGLERGLAELLSNPKLAAAVAGRLEHPIEPDE